MKKIEVVDELSYLKAKNRLIKRVTGITLIPEDQLVGHTIPTDKSSYVVFEASKELRSNNCTYCVLYYNNTVNACCDGCPMAAAGNKCEQYDSTWTNARDGWNINASLSDLDELVTLGNTLTKILKSRGGKNGKT